MCDFQDFGLTFFSVFVLLKMLKNVFWVVARLPQRLKSTFFEIFFFTPLAPSELLHSKKLWKSHIVLCPNSLTFGLITIYYLYFVFFVRRFVRCRYLLMMYSSFQIYLEVFIDISINTNIKLIVVIKLWILLKINSSQIQTAAGHIIIMNFNSCTSQFLRNMH